MSSKVVDRSDTPVIDLGQLGREPTAEVWRRIGQEFLAAFTDFGYAYVVNHGVPDDVVSDMFEASTKFFNLPEDEKSSIETDGFHGYMAVGRQRICENYEIREILDIRRLNEPLPDARVPEMRGATSRLKFLMSVLSVRIMRALEFALELEENKLLKAHSQTLLPFGDNTVLRMTHYPPVPSACPPNAVRLGAHTDYGSISLDIQDEHGGLEVRNRRGEWVRPQCSQKGAMILLVGDALELWTNEKLQATPHRVTVPKNDRLRRLPRRSVIFACQPNSDAKLAPFDGSPSETSDLAYKDYSQTKQKKTLAY